MRGSCPAKEVSLTSWSNFSAPAQTVAGERGKANLAEEKEKKQKREGKDGEIPYLVDEADTRLGIRLKPCYPSYSPRDISAYRTLVSNTHTPTAQTLSVSWSDTVRRFALLIPGLGSGALWTL